MTDDCTPETLGEVAGEHAVIKNELADVRVRYEMLHKRQVLPLDEGFLAIRHEIGWLIGPQEDCATVLHLSDGVSRHSGTTEVIQRGSTARYRRRPWLANRLAQNSSGPASRAKTTGYRGRSISDRRSKWCLERSRSRAHDDMYSANILFARDEQRVTNIGSGSVTLENQ